MSDAPYRTRIAAARDAAAIATIYNQGIEDRIATFQTEPRDPATIARILAEKGDRLPAVIVERNGTVVAFAWVSAYRDSPWYRGIGEHSVYVARAHRGRGAGLIALEALCGVCAERGFWKLVSRIFPENSASLALHERAGFRVVGTYERHGKLDNQWRDCVIVERLFAGDEFPIDARFGDPR